MLWFQRSGPGARILACGRFQCLGRIGRRLQESEWARQTWEYVAPIHICGHCPHPSNHLRRRIHQPSLLAPQYTSQDACPAREFCSEKMEPFDFLSFFLRSEWSAKNLSGLVIQDNVIVSTSRGKTSTPGPDLRLPNSFELRRPTLLHVSQFHPDSRPQSSHARVARYRNSAGAVCHANRDQSRCRWQLFELQQLQ